MKSKTPILLLFLFFVFFHDVSAQEFFLSRMWNDEEYRFPHHYSELIGSWDAKDDALILGANYTFIPSKTGFYGSFMYGLNGSFNANVGPAFRLTNSNSTGIDIHLFQGIGINDGNLEGETGIRFGFGRDWKYGRWSISGSVNYTKGKIGWSAGLSWPLAGVTAASGLIIGYAVLAAYTGTSIPEINKTSDNTPSVNSSSSSPSVNNKTTDRKNCEQYQREYSDQLSIVIRNYKEYADSKKYASMVGQATFRKNLVSSQTKLKNIRRKAESKGCRIERSEYEYRMP